MRIVLDMRLRLAYEPSNRGNGMARNIRWKIKNAVALAFAVLVAQLTEWGA